MKGNNKEDDCNDNDKETISEKWEKVHGKNGKKPDLKALCTRGEITISHAAKQIGAMLPNRFEILSDIGSKVEESNQNFSNNEEDNDENEGL